MPKPRVMLAEDDLTMVNLLKTLLQMEGFEVIALDVDQDVVQALSESWPDVLLMDVHLARQNGLEILDEIRRAENLSKVRVIMTSGLNLKDECVQHGADAFVLKPFMPDDLISVLKGTPQP